MPDRPLTDPGVQFFRTGLFRTVRFRAGQSQHKLTLALSAMAHREVGIAIPQFIVLADVSFVDCTVLSSASPGFWPQVLPDDLTPALLIDAPS